MHSSSNSRPRIMSLQERLNSSKVEKIYHRLPDSARTILDIMQNKDVLLRMVGRFGGCTLKIPARWPPVGRCSSHKGHPLRRVLTPNQMDAMVKHYGGTSVYIPHCTRLMQELRNEVIIKSFIKESRKGKSSGKIVQKLARRYRLSDRRIWEILKITPENLESTN